MYPWLRETKGGTGFLINSQRFKDLLSNQNKDQNQNNVKLVSYNGHYSRKLDSDRLSPDHSREDDYSKNIKDLRNEGLKALPINQVSFSALKK